VTCSLKEFLPKVIYIFTVNAINFVFIGILYGFVAVLYLQTSVMLYMYPRSARNIVLYFGSIIIEICLFYSYFFVLCLFLAYFRYKGR
jgi:hypothetical protein